MVRLSNVGEGFCFVSSNHVGINVVQSLVPSGVTGDMLVESGEDCLQVGVVEVTSNNKGSLRVFGLVFANGCIKFFHSQLSISIRGGIHCSEYDGSEFSGEIEGPAFDH